MRTLHYAGYGRGDLLHVVDRHKSLLVVPFIRADREGIFMEGAAFTVEIFINRSVGIDGMKASHILREDFGEILHDGLCIGLGMGEGREHIKAALLLGIDLDDLLDNGIEVVCECRLIVGGGPHGNDNQIRDGAGKPGMELAGTLTRDVHDDEVIVSGNGFDTIGEDLFLGAGYVVEGYIPGFFSELGPLSPPGPQSPLGVKFYKGNGPELFIYMFREGGI